MINKFSILNAVKYFSLGTFPNLLENYLVFKPAKKYIKYFSGTTRIESWKSYRILEDSIENISKPDSNFAPTFVNHHLFPDMTFSGHSFIQNNISIIKKVINLYISYTLNLWLRNLNINFALNN